MPEQKQNKTFPKCDEIGASLVEYALMIALVALVCVGAIGALGGNNGDGIDRSASLIDSAVN